MTNKECRQLSSNTTSVVHDFVTLCARCVRFDQEYVGNRDSGGPLISNNKLIGIVSWGADKLVNGFTRISEYTDWIEKIIQDKTE